MTPERVNISHVVADTVVQQVLDRIDREVLVVDALGDDGVQGVIQALAARQPEPGPFSLDLIAHSRRGVLQLGDWSVESNANTIALQRNCAQELARLRLAEIRLLGCNTAVTRDGQSAIKGVHELFDVPVVGTKMPISARDFDGSGFCSTAILTNQDHLPPPSVPSLQSAGRWHGRFERVSPQLLPDMLERLRRESLEDALRDWSQTRPKLRWPVRQITRTQLDIVLGYTAPEVIRAPGLLALPDLELLLPVADELGTQRYHRLTILLGYWVRIYPRQAPDGVVLRGDSDDLLVQALVMGDEVRS